VLDTRNAPGRLGEIARMCEGAGIECLWVRDHFAPSDEQPRLEAWTALTLAAMGVSRARLGAMLTMSFRPPTTLAAMAGTLDAATGGRFELGLSPGWSEREHLAFGFDFPDPEQAAGRLERYASIVRELLAGRSAAVTDFEGVGPAELGVASPQVEGPPLSIEAVTPGQVEVAARLADDVVVPSAAARDVKETVQTIVQSCERVGRDPSTLGIALEAPVSIGRTIAEAQARAESDLVLRTLDPRHEGIFGTLEQCQERIIELAHAGVSDLRCVLPNSPDVHDVIAQLTAVAIGSPDVLLPGAPKSRAPDPPEAWGGRPFRGWSRAREE
jgi:alkanesulfonate monooxygenase SsuD/methylene tetrahydromethanopterin reductase-like flavin-dependent oxidoreductase (luciferase family)